MEHHRTTLQQVSVPFQRFCKFESQIGQFLALEAETDAPTVKYVLTFCNAEISKLRKGNHLKIELHTYICKLHAKKSTVPSGKPKNVFKDQMWSHVSELDLIYWNCGRKIIIESDIYVPNL